MGAASLRRRDGLDDRDRPPRGLTKAAVARSLNALVKGQRASKEKRGREVFYGRS